MTIIVLDPDKWIFTVIPILSIVGIVYTIVGFAFWRTGKFQCRID